MWREEGDAHDRRFLRTGRFSLASIKREASALVRIPRERVDDPDEADAAAA